MKKFFTFLLLFLFLFPVTDVYASATNSSGNINFSTLNKDLNAIDSKLKSGNVSTEYMSSTIQSVNETRSILNEYKKGIEKELRFTQKKIDAIGEEPTDGSKEVAAIAQKRKEFNNELSTQRGKIVEADIMLARLDAIDIKIYNLRSKELFGNLFDKQESLIYPSNLFNANKLLVVFLYDIAYSPIRWFEELNTEENAYVRSNLMPVLFIFFLSLWIGTYLRLFIMRRFGYDKEIEHPRYNKKVSAAIFVAIAYGVIPASIIAGMLIWLASSKILTVGFFGLVLGSFLYFLLYIIMGRALSRVVFAPYNEKWRLINVNNEKAKRLTSALYGAVTAIGILSFLEYLADKSNNPIELSAFIATISSFIKTFFIILIIKRLLWDRNSSDTLCDTDENFDDVTMDNTFRITFFATLAGVVICGIAIFGYPFLSSFILNHLIMSFLLLGLLLILRKAFEELMHRLLLMRVWAKTFRLKRKILLKLNFWLNLVVDPIFVLCGFYSILALWGVSTGFLNHSIIKLLTGFTVGGIRISLISIILGIAIFFISVSIVKALKKHLYNNVLSKMDIDDGIKNSLVSGLGFVGFVVSALLAIAIMGGDLSNVALIAGALSVGIGLGLQNIVNNFVSGIILLFERPIKVGDWVIINGEEGRVKQINIRSTEIETFKKSSLIVPNSAILSSTVTNLTHSNKNARLSLSVSVSYNADPERVTEILLDCAKAHKRVLKNPAPCVVFKNFGSDGLEFELRCHTADIWAGWAIPSDLRYDILSRFDEEKIEIPFPQRSLHIGDEVTRKAVNHMLQHKAEIKVKRTKRQTKTRKKEVNREDDK